MRVAIDDYNMKGACCDESFQFAPLLPNRLSIRQEGQGALLPAHLFHSETVETGPRIV